MPVTREEIAAHVHRAFIPGVATKENLLAAAALSGARTEVLEVLGRLSDRPYREIRQIWPDLPDVPVDVDQARKR